MQNTATDNGTVNDHSTHNNSTTIIINNNIGTRPLEREDLSYITPEMWTHISRLAGLDPESAVKVLVQLVNFNPSQPQNMNTYIPADDTKPAAVFHNSSRHGFQDWCRVDRDIAVKWLIDGRCSQLQEFMGDNEERVRPQDARSFDVFASQDDTPEALERTIMKLAQLNSRYMEASQRAPCTVERDFPFSARALARMQERAAARMQERES